jgi:hypothetical protein
MIALLTSPGCETGDATSGQSDRAGVSAATGSDGSEGVSGSEPDGVGRRATGVDSFEESGPTADVNGGRALGDSSGASGGVNSSGAAVAPGCVDGDYAEALPTPEVSIEAEVAGYTSAGYMEFIDAVLQKRYPIGAHLINAALLDQSWGHCVDTFLSQKGTADQVIGSMSTLVHECGHFLDGSTGGFFSDSYVVTETLTFTCSGGSTPDNGGGETFSRSLIKSDPYSDLWPPCASFASGGACDSYAPIYLDGDPNDDNFDSGDQGFGSLLEETVQYVNSLATGYAFNDYYTWGVSERDGILTFLWYVQRYLRLARLEHPAAYEHLINSSCWREAILTVWGRGWMFLLVTEDYPQLGISDDILEPLALDADLNEEIQRVREAHGCP